MKLRDALWVLFISMVPLIELRGAVPVGAVLGLPFYVNYAVAVIGNLIPIPFILLFIPKILDWLEQFKLFRPIVQWLHKKADKNRGKIDKSVNTDAAVATATDEGSACTETDANAASVTESASEGAVISDTVSGVPSNTEVWAAAKDSRMSVGTFIGLMLFVLLPIPGTGAWTGALVASLFGFSRMKSFLAIALGVLGCGVIMCLASYGVLGFLSFLL